MASKVLATASGSILFTLICGAFRDPALPPLVRAASYVGCLPLQTRRLVCLFTERMVCGREHTGTGEGLRADPRVMIAVS